MITEGSSAASSSFRTLSISLRWLGFTTRTRRKPTARHRASKSTFPAGSPRRFFPVVGFCWWPVMPVMELSRIMMVEFVWL